jgi:Protein of unknown function (DUF760)
MSNLSHYNSENFELESMNNMFSQYLQSLNPETVVQLSKPNSLELVEVIQRSIAAILGNIPNDPFDSNITTTRDELGQILGSAMIDGYFLGNAEQRMELESLYLVDANSESA